MEASMSRITLRRDEAVLNIYNLAIGLFLLVSPWLLALSHQAARADILVIGALLIAVSAVALVAFATWEEWISLLLGLWLVVSPWVLGFAHTRAAHLGIGAGLVIAYLAALELWLLYEERSAPHDGSATPAIQR
jgi:hypothetical protein